MDLQAETILDHYRHPRAKKSLSQPTVSHTEINASCGDQLTIELMIEKGHIQEVGWSGEGCAISQAGMSLLSEELVGKSEAEIAALGPQDLYDLLGVPIGTRRVKCALLSLHALKNALRKLHGEQEQTWRETVQSAG